MLLKSVKRCSIGMVGIFMALTALTGFAEDWSRRYIEGLPDSAFAAIEVTKDGKKVRHLPHHNDGGDIDIGHLKSALSRVHQVKWIDPANLAKAKDHLAQHDQVYKLERANLKGSPKKADNSNPGSLDAAPVHKRRTPSP